MNKSNIATAIAAAIIVSACGGSDSSAVNEDDLLSRYEGPFGELQTDSEDTSTGAQLTTYVTPGAALTETHTIPNIEYAEYHESTSAHRKLNSTKAEHASIKTRKREDTTNTKAVLISAQPITEAERRTLLKNNRKTSEISNRSFQTGHGRLIAKIESIKSKNAGQTLNWTTKSDGTRVATIGVEGGNAKAMRLGIHVTSLPNNALLRFYGNESQTEVELNGSHVKQRLSGTQVRTEHKKTDNLLWGPATNGSRGMLDIVLPPSAKTGDVSLAIAQATFLEFTPGEIAQRNAAKAWGDAGSCNIDAVCQLNENPELADAADAALYLDYIVYDQFGIGSSYTCTGTIIGDTAQSDQLYALTADHCIGNQNIADTVFAQARLRSESCNSETPEDFFAYFDTDYLYSETRARGSDVSLLKLGGGSIVPGISVAGWNASTVTTSTRTHSFHHPSGDGLKYSSGVSRPRNANFLSTVWSSGVTEPGSSGSALLNDDNQIIGTLWGGSSSCENPRGADEHGRFSVSYGRGMRPWLYFSNRDLLTAADTEGTGFKQLLWSDRVADGRGIKSLAISTHTSEGQIGRWGSEFSSYMLPYYLRSGPNRVFLGVADLNGDRQDEFLFRRSGPSGDEIIAIQHRIESSDDDSNPYYYSGWEEVVVWSYISPRVRLVGFSDLDGDGHADMVLHDPAQNLLKVVRLISEESGAIYDHAELPTMMLPAGFQPFAIGNFAGDTDTRSEVMLRNTRDGTQIKLLNWVSDEMTLQQTNASLMRFPGDLIGIADFNSDGKLDFAFNRRGQLLYSFSQAASEAAPNTANYSLSAPVVVGRQPSNSFLAVLADVNGDGFTDQVWRNRTTGSTEIGIGTASSLSWHSLNLTARN